jgi:hypothetical protein
MAYRTFDAEETENMLELNKSTLPVTRESMRNGYLNIRSDPRILKYEVLCYKPKQRM